MVSAGTLVVGRAICGGIMPRSSDADELDRPPREYQAQRDTLSLNDHLLTESSWPRPQMGNCVPVPSAFSKKITTTPAGRSHLREVMLSGMVPPTRSVTPGGCEV